MIAFALSNEQSRESLSESAFQRWKLLEAALVLASWRFKKDSVILAAHKDQGMLKLQPKGFLANCLWTISLTAGFHSKISRTIRELLIPMLCI